jgi:methylglutaconyl-CoA hydratase
VRALGAAQARRYMLTGERLTAAEARRIGFVHECVPAAELDGAVERLCAHLAQGGPEALARTKKLLAHVEAAPLTPALAAETAAALAEARASAEAREGMRAFLEKRKPGWQ